MSGARSLAARLRADPVPGCGDATVRPASGAGSRSARVHGRPGPRQRGPRRLRLGWACRLHRRGALARALPRPRDGRRLQHPGHRECRSTGAGVGGISILVSVVLQHRARSLGPRAEPARHLQVALAALVADVAVRRRDVRPNSRRASTTPTSWTSSSTRTGIDTGRRGGTRLLEWIERTSCRTASDPRPDSRPPRCRGHASLLRPPRQRMRAISSAHTSVTSSRTPDTCCLAKRQTPSSPPSRR